MTNNPKNTAMNLEYKDIRETNRSKNEPAILSDKSSDGTAPACLSTEPQAVAEKSLGFRRPWFVITGVALCMGLNSCVVPYDSDGGGSVTVSSYSPGYRINSLPGGYRSETISGSTYYYHDGYYYRPGSGGYVVVDAPRGSRYYDEYSRRQRIYQTNQDFRSSSARDGQRYERTQIISRLPDGYREVNHRGQRYYQSGDRYYRRQGDSYIIVSSPY
jgi:hypothetical protein